MMALFAYSCILVVLRLALAVITLMAKESLEKVRFGLAMSVYAYFAISIFISLASVIVADRKIAQDGDDDEMDWESGTEKYVVAPFEEDPFWIHIAMAIINPTAELAIITSLKPVIALASFIHLLTNFTMAPRLIKTMNYLLGHEESIDNFMWPSSLAYLAYSIAFKLSVVIVIVSKSRKR